MGLLELAFANPPVDGVHACRAHGDADLPGTRVGLFGIDESQDFRTAELGEAHFLHTAEIFAMIEGAWAVAPGADSAAG